MRSCTRLLVSPISNCAAARAFRWLIILAVALAFGRNVVLDDVRGVPALRVALCFVIDCSPPRIGHHTPFRSVCSPLRSAARGLVCFVFRF